MWEWMLGIDLVGRVKVVAHARPEPAVPAARGPPPARPERARRDLAPARGRAGRARGADLRWARSRDARGHRRVPAVERRAMDGGRAERPGSGFRRSRRLGGRADLALDIADLATVYLGAFTFADLAAPGGSASAAPARSRPRTRSSPRPPRRGAPRCSEASPAVRQARRRTPNNGSPVVWMSPAPSVIDTSSRAGQFGSYRCGS